MMPVIGNPDFSPGISDPKFHQFIEMNKFRLQDFSNFRGWKSTTDIQSMLSPPLPVWQAFQLWHYSLSLSFSSVPLDMPTVFERLCASGQIVNRGLSGAYAELIAPILLHGKEI